MTDSKLASNLEKQLETRKINFTTLCTMANITRDELEKLYMTEYVGANNPVLQKIAAALSCKPESLL